ncbi:MAG: efflux RND transporter periplasmic adaptor subunit [Bacteroidales bacterium]|nr:efflux RND transporter periplasmic adaptor subunit [Bacteroidales bacterium]
MNKIKIIPAIALIAGILVSCGGKSDKTTAQKDASTAEKVQTQVLAKETISRELVLSSTLEGYESMSISPSLTGKIEHIYVEVGSRVGKGQLLVRMDQTQLNTTKINLASAQTEFNRVQALKETGSVSQQVYDQTKAQLDQLTESEKFLQANTFVRAQFSGVIAAKNYEDGELYSGAPILVLSQIGTLKAIINIPETYFPKVKKGMKVNVYSDIYPDEAFPATIEIVYPTIDPASHTFQAKLRIPNAKEKIRPGMYVRTTLALGQTETIVVPYQAVLKLTGSNDRYVFVNDGGKARRVAVTLGQRFDDRIEIIPENAEELKEGDELVVVGQARLVDGSRLEIVKN